jgi:hypothetical protein
MNDMEPILYQRMRNRLKRRVSSKDIVASKDYQSLAAVCAMMDLLKDVRVISVPLERQFIRFDSEEIQTNFREFFRFEKKDMLELLQCLGVEAHFRLDNGVWVNSQESLLVTLRMLASSQRLVDLEAIFGYDISQLSRIFNYVMNFIYVCISSIRVISIV